MINRSLFVTLCLCRFVSYSKTSSNLSSVPQFTMAVFDPCDPSTLCSATLFCGPFAPKLGLSEDGSAEFRIYLLRCAPQITGGPFCWYVGLCHRSQLRRRVEAHFVGKGADFTLAHQPSQVELVWPAREKAAEAFLFFAMVAKLPQAAVTGGRVGGWTQTRPKASPVSQLL